MQTKVLLILSILVLHTLVACTKPKSDNEQESSEITLADETLNEKDSAEAAFDSASISLDNSPIESEKAAVETEKKEENSAKTVDLEPAVSNKPVAEKVVKAIEAKKIPVVTQDSSPVVKEQKIEAVPEDTIESNHTVEKEEAPKTVSHEIWDQLLRKYVSSSGKVNYKGLKAEKGRLDTYIKLLSEHKPTGEWSRNEQLAYWINVYNANTVKLILENYPLKSITDLGKPWDKKFILMGSTAYTLNQVENEIIRPVFKEPRIHFAVNCAAKSCPPLLNEAFTADKLNSQLEKQTRAFINSSSNSISSGKVELSKIFEWYGGDFGDLVSYVQRYSSTQIEKSAKVSFKEYDWALNE
jgi:hypothetical protein